MWFHAFSSSPIRSIYSELAREQFYSSCIFSRCTPSNLLNMDIFTVVPLEFLFTPV